MSWMKKCLPLKNHRIGAVHACELDSVIDSWIPMTIQVVRLVLVLEEHLPMRVQVVHGV